MLDAVPLSAGQRRWVLAACLFGLLLDGVALAMMTIAAPAVSKSLMGNDYTTQAGGVWFARYSASLMLGGAVGGLLVGNLGDVIGRAKALGLSIILYSVFAGLGKWVTTQEQMVVLRFFVGLGVGGVWPSAMALAAECWPNVSRPLVSGILACALNTGIFLFARAAQVWKITEESWRQYFLAGALPTIVGLAVLIMLPESVAWRKQRSLPRSAPVWRELFGPTMWRITLIGILLGAIPSIGAWAASKWMIPWADAVAGQGRPEFKAIVHGWWSFGAILGSFGGSPIAAWVGRRRAYVCISLGAVAVTEFLFLGTTPTDPIFLPAVFVQGLITSLYFGWLPLCLPELFPTSVRAMGSGVSFNTGRFITAGTILLSGEFLRLTGGANQHVGAFFGLIYLFGLVVIWASPIRNE